MKNRIKEDNHGFTLVEIVVTIVVLAIITVPLLSYFTDSVRHSARTKQQQNAVVLAQNTLEELKVNGQDLSDPHNLLEASADDEDADADADADADEDADADDAAPAATPTLIPWKEIADKELPDPVDGFYPSYYLYRNVSENGRSYLVQIKVTPKHNLTNTNEDGDERTEIYEKVTMPEINSSTDVILQEDSTSFNEAVRQFHTTHANLGGSLTRDQIAADVHRSMRLTFQKDVENTDNVVVIIYYNYHYEGTGFGMSGSNTYYQVSVKRASIPAKDLRNIFIFFQPDSDKGDHLQFGPEDVDDPNGESSEDFSTLGLDEGQVSLYLVARNAVQEDGTVVARPDTYRFTLGNATEQEVYKIFTDPAGSEKTIFTNLSKSEVDASASAGLGNLFYTKNTASGGTEYTLLKQEETDRIAEVEVSVYRDIGDGENTLNNEKQKLTTVNGTVVLGK